MVTFQNLLVKIFKSHGFDIDSTSDYNKYILATKDNVTLSVGYSEPGEEVTVGKLREFFRQAKKDNADRYIYITPENYPVTIDRFASDRQIQLWNSERLEREVGRALVTDFKAFGEISQAGIGLDGIISSTKKSTIDSKESSVTSTTSSDQESSSGDIPIMVPTMIFGEEAESTSKSTTSTIDSDTRPEQTLSLSPEIKDINIIKPKVTKELAASMANKIVKGFRFNLELIPYYVFDYSLEFNLENQENTASAGLLGINGLTSNIEDWSESMETVQNIEEPHTKLDVKFSYDNALSLIKQAIMERNTKLIETREEYDSTIIFEKKKLKPKPEAININTKGLFYLPVWCIEGSNGLMIIDANSGKVIKEDIYKTS